jgi:DNA polymerase-4
MMFKLMGSNGTELWRKANGIDETPVIPFHEQKSLSSEKTFQQDTTDMRMLHGELIRMTESLAFDLRKQEKLTGCITVKLRYSNFETFTKQQTISYTNADHILFKKVEELFNKLYERRMLIRLIGVRFSHLIPGHYQIHLFDDTEEMIRLYQAIDSVKNKYGEQYVIKAGGQRKK